MNNLTKEIVLIVDETNDPIINKIKEKFANENQQKIFKLTFNLFNKYKDTNKDEFIIDLNEVFELIGFTRDDNAIKLLEKDFVKNVDYIIGSTNKIMMKLKTFKKFCLKSQTKVFEQIYEYYLTMDEISQEHLEEQFQEQLKIKDRESKQKDNKLKEKELELKRKEQEYQNQLKIKELELQEIKEKTYEEIEKSGYVYIFLCDGGLKVGRTDKDSVDKRKKELQTANVNKIKTIFECKTSNSDLLEKSVHYVLDRYRMNSNREFFDCDVEYIKWIIEILNVSIDTMKSTYRTITKEELYNRYQTKLELIKKNYEIEEYEEKCENPIEKLIRENYIYGEEKDYVLIKDIKDLLNNTDNIIITNTILKIFPDVEYFNRKTINYKNYRYVFLKLKKIYTI